MRPFEKNVQDMITDKSKIIEILLEWLIFVQGFKYTILKLTI